MDVESQLMQYRLSQKIKYEDTKKPEKRPKWNYFKSCLNESEIRNIPGLYRFRISITPKHLLEYSESGVPSALIEEHRYLRNSIYEIDNIPDTEIFRWCFDVRKLYPKRNQPFEIEGCMYYLQPDDHIKLHKIWNLITNPKYINRFFDDKIKSIIQQII